jgi:hypothetical protein
LHEPVRRSSCVDWSAYPRLRRTILTRMPKRDPAHALRRDAQAAPCIRSWQEARSRPVCPSRPPFPYLRAERGSRAARRAWRGRSGPAGRGDVNFRRCLPQGSSDRRSANTIGPSSDPSLGQSSIPSLSDGVMLGTAWIDRPVDTRGALPASTSSPAQHGSAAMLKPMIDIPLASWRCRPAALPGRPGTADKVAAA